MDAVTGAYFEGEGEILVRPPDRMERASLGLFIGAGVLEEKFSSAYLRFNDDTAKELEPYLRPPEDAADFVSRNDATARTASFRSTPCGCAFPSPAPPQSAFRASSLRSRSPAACSHRGDHYGIFDVFFDTRSPEQIVVGNASSHEDQIYYDLWMSFPMRSLRKTPLSDARFDGPSGPAVDTATCSPSTSTPSPPIWIPPRTLSAEATLDVRGQAGWRRALCSSSSRAICK